MVYGVYIILYVYRELHFHSKSCLLAGVKSAQIRVTSPRSPLIGHRSAKRLAMDRGARFTRWDLNRALEVAQHAAWRIL